MSRIGAAPINIPAGVSVEYNNGSMLIKSAKAEKEVSLIRDVVCQIIDNQLLLSVDQDKDNYDKIKPMWALIGVILIISLTHG
ncbi:50S ribosomal protein L6 [Trichonephila clavata]|uniref:50S ribosomal protein L6 n=1 Tax=Trichonephila clavata TaxID=2740835 RepID=A0A8X6K5S9_TRICU|nr:50S ribosomal protein L6 [Trichonephila clavata]